MYAVYQRPPKELYRLKVRGWKKIFYANGNKKAGVAIFISDKIVLTIKTVTVFIKKNKETRKDTI